MMGFDDVFDFTMDGFSNATDDQNKINQQYTADKNAANTMYARDINDRNRYVADTGNRRDMMDYGFDANLAMSENQTAVNLFDRRYGVENLQAGYDKFEAEFGDMQDNVYNTMKRLSTHSMTAEINDKFNANLQHEMQGLQQRFAEMGINPKSGLYQQSQMMLQMNNESEKIKATRNIDTDIASTKANFMNNEANSKYFTRPEDFNKGIMTDDERKAIITPGDFQKAGEYDINTYDVMKPEVEKAEREKFLGIF